jgi:hypothetical protein
MEYYEHGSLATAQLLWAYPAQTVVIPATQLYTSLVQTNQAPVVGAGADQTITCRAPRHTDGHGDTLGEWSAGDQQLDESFIDHHTAPGIVLAAGVKYTLKLEYYEATGQATARLQWSYPGQPTQVIPASRLFQ